MIYFSITDESVMLKYNIIIIESDWLAIVCISSGSFSQLMLGEIYPNTVFSIFRNTIERKYYLSKHKKIEKRN